MKRKQVDRVERRRPQVEPNLIGGNKSRSVPGARGCLPFLSSFVFGLAGLGLLALGHR
jgi:hypothetical protein